MLLYTACTGWGPRMAGVTTRRELTDLTFTHVSLRIWEELGSRKSLESRTCVSSEKYCSFKNDMMGLAMSQPSQMSCMILTMVVSCDVVVCIQVEGVLYSIPDSSPFLLL